METAITRDGQRRNSWMCGDDYVEEGEEKKAQNGLHTQVMRLFFSVFNVNLARKGRKCN